MKKIKLFLYENAQPHGHDLDPHYYNTLPLSKEGIKKYCNLTSNPQEADYFYLGQAGGEINEHFEQFLLQNFKYFEKYNSKHIIDVSGDAEDLPECLINYDCYITSNIVLEKIKIIKKYVYVLV